MCIRDRYFIVLTLASSLPQSLEGIERVHTVKLLGLNFNLLVYSFSFVNHVDAILKICGLQYNLCK